MPSIRAPAKILFTGKPPNTSTLIDQLIFTLDFEGANGYFATYAIKDLLQRGYKGKPSHPA
jgi:hypothetical protein